MPKKTLYSLLTDLTTPAELIDNMKPFFAASLDRLGVPAFAANAIANVFGQNGTAWFRLWESKKNPASLATSSAGYTADEVGRYFFEYGSPAHLDGRAYILEYSRFEKFELRGSVWNHLEEKWDSMRLEDAGAKEAICAMLFAIMQYESNSSGFAMITAGFAREYRLNFPSGPARAEDILGELFLQLKDQINPATRAAYNAPFQVDSSYLNARDGCLKALLRNEKIGYVKTEEPTVMFAPDMLLMPLSENNAALEQQHLFVLEGILKTVRSDCPVTVEPNMYPIDPDRVYDDEDRSRLLTIPDWYVPVPAVMNIAKAVAGSSIFRKPFRNIMMRGPAGSGKTEGAKALASMFGNPYGVITGHAELEFFDLTSNLIPNTESKITTDAELYDYLLYALRDSGLALPSFLEIASMPDVVYEQITGIENEEAGEAECFAALTAKLISVCKKDVGLFSGENSKFKVVYSDLAMGFQRGWLVELQEMNTILKPGVLVGLNNILENGQLRLPTGEVIQRHPDTVIVFTQNVGYAGTTDGNQSVYSRIEVKCDLNHPSEDEMVERIRMHVPEITEQACRTIVQTVLRIQDNCSAEIEGGSVGTREAINWAKMTVLLGGDMRAAAELTVLPSVGEDPDDIALVRTCIHQSIEELE